MDFKDQPKTQLTMFWISAVGLFRSLRSVLSLISFQILTTPPIPPKSHWRELWRTEDTYCYCLLISNSYCLLIWVLLASLLGNKRYLMAPPQQWESCSWGINAFWKKENFWEKFYNERVNVSAVTRQQQHQSQESLQIEIAVCSYDTGWIMQALAYCTHRRWKLDQQSSLMAAGGRRKREVRATTVPSSV